MSINEMLDNLEKQVLKHTAPPVYRTIYYEEWGILYTHQYVPGTKHFCGIRECPSNDSP